MKAVVVYESLWGNTAAIARAIAEGIGNGACALSTAEASEAAIADVDLLVVGAPIHAFGLPTNQSREQAAANPEKVPSPPDLSHPSMRAWLKALPKGHAHAAAFETRLPVTLGSATAAILRALKGAGYHPIAKGQRFIVQGSYGPLREGEVERARQWGAELVEAIK